MSTLKFEYMGDAARVAVTTTLAAATGGCTTLAVHVALKNPPDVFPALNGILAGLVSLQDLVLLLNRGQLPSLVLLGALYTMDRVRYSRSCRSTIPLMRLPSISSAVFGVFFQQVCSLKSLTLLESMEKMRIPMVLSWVVVESNSETKSSVYLQLLVGYVLHALLFSEA